MITEGKYYTFKNPEIKFKINKDLSGNSKNVVYIIECSKCKEIYIASTQALISRISLHKSNIKITENRKLNVSKYLYECSQDVVKIMPKYQTNNYMLLQIKEKEFNPTHTQMDTNIHTHTHIYIHIYTHTKIKSKK